MASLLTSTSFSGRLYYIGLIFTFAGFVVYWLFLREPGIEQDLQRRAFHLNYAAFQNSVRLFNYRYLLKSAQNPGEQVEINGLVFNQQGFPIGAKIGSRTSNQPASASDCRDIWKNTLGPLQPLVSLIPEEKNYWVELSIENHCVFHAGKFNDETIVFDAVKGLVSLITING